MIKILISGPPRSGTTWIAETLSVATNVPYLHEIDNPDENASAWPSVFRYGLYPILQLGDPAPTYSGLWDSALVKGEIRALRSPRLRGALSKLPKPLATGMINGSLHLSGTFGRTSAGVVTKSVFSCFSLEWIADRYRPTVVIVRRNPLNIISSWRTLGWRAPTRADRNVIGAGFERQMEALEIPPPPSGSDFRRLAWWIAVQLRAQELLAARHPEWTVVTHDDLCLAPGDAWGEAFSRLEVEFPQQGMEYLEAQDRHGDGPFETRRSRLAQPDAWRRGLSDEEVSEAIAVLETFPHAWWARYLPG